MVHGFNFSKGGLEVEGTPSFEQWLAVGEFIKKAEHSVQMWLGDWLNFGQRNYGEKYTQALETTEYEYSTLRNAAYVAARVPKEIRRDKLSFSHHQVVASLEPGDQDVFLRQAEENGWTRLELSNKVRSFKRSSFIPSGSLDNATGNFGLILYRPSEENDFLTTFTKLCMRLDDGGIMAVFSSNSRLFEVVSLLKNSNTDYFWTIALHADSEYEIKRNITSFWQPVIVFRKSPKSALSVPLRDICSMRAMVESLSSDTNRVLVVGNDLIENIGGKEVVVVSEKGGAI
jgi:hypothetical protein